jgi:hypothetical protein
MTATEAMRAALEQIAGRNRDFPELACQERSRGYCGKPATRVARIEGMGHVVVCQGCARFYADSTPIQLPRDLGVLVGNLRDQARHALEQE